MQNDEDLSKEEPSELDREALLKRVKDMFNADAPHCRAWHAKAKDDFGFVVGEQWKEEDRAALEEQRRPVITFNRCLSIIKSISGLEINARHDIVFVPRGTEPGTVKANELLTHASAWMDDGCDALDEQSEAFQDCVICGMGWTETRIGYDEEPDGKYIETKVDPLEMFWDRKARSKNLQDARRIYRVRKMPVAEARVLAESLGADDLTDADLDANWAHGADTESGKSLEDRRRRDGNSDGASVKDEVTIVHAQWIENECYYRVADGATGKIIELTEEKYSEYRKLAKKHAINFEAVKQTRKSYKHAFFGAELIGDVMPGPAKSRFTIQAITGERDRNAGTWFGLVRLMRDPQQWANKWLSQTLHILNTTAKGGIIAEQDAFADQRQAEETYAKPDAITWASKGAVSSSKIMQKPGAGLSQPYMQMMEFGISSIRDATGINLELLGMRDANQPGILEAQRKQASMTILATLFDSLRRFRKNVGRVRLVYIQNYLSDGRLIRISGDKNDIKVVQLLRDETAGDYEIIVEDAPNSPNQKQEVWATLQQVMPVFKGMMTPETAIMMLEYSPLPSKLVDALKEMAGKPNPGQQMQQQIGMAKAKADIDKINAGAEKDRATAEATRATAILDLATAGAQAAAAQLDAATANVMSPQPWEQQQAPSPEQVNPHAMALMQQVQQMRQAPQVPTEVQPNPAQPAPQPALSA